MTALIRDNKAAGIVLTAIVRGLVVAKMKGIISVPALIPPGIRAGVKKEVEDK